MIVLPCCYTCCTCATWPTHHVVGPLVLVEVLAVGAAHQRAQQVVRVGLRAVEVVPPARLAGPRARGRSGHIAARFRGILASNINAIY